MVALLTCPVIPNWALLTRTGTQEREKNIRGYQNRILCVSPERLWASLGSEFFFKQKRKENPGLVAYACNLRTWEVRNASRDYSEFEASLQNQQTKPKGCFVYALSSPHFHMERREGAGDWQSS